MHRDFHILGAQPLDLAGDGPCGAAGRQDVEVSGSGRRFAGAAEALLGIRSAMFIAGPAMLSL
ncbi:hypothetical protein X759_33625 [Mesorhizobium sp. LSHC420B00]|nr:hypothetical protein X759_33625 [Mesorhizobium sp. LSHC420B00]